LSKWREPILDRLTSDERKAVFVLWNRYWSALRALHVLRDHRLLMDAYTIARTCLECDVAIKAICARPELGADYVRHRLESTGKHLSKMEKQGLTGDVTLLAEEWFRSVFGADWSELPPRGWHWYKSDSGVGVDALLRDFEPGAQHLYFGFSNAAHGFYQGLVLFEAQYAEMDRFLAAVTDMYTVAFLHRSMDLSPTIWGPIDTEESDAFKAELVALCIRRGLPKPRGT
jgi:hypothetical protein